MIPERHRPVNRLICLMNNYQEAFLRFAISARALEFGDFTLKSGRRSPYFFNAGRFCSGADFAQFGGYYAAAIQAGAPQFDLLFGPAYKGIPLSVAAAIALYQETGRSVPVAYNRKETKDHGEGGQLVGAPLHGRVLIVDDVITAGTAVREVVELVRAAGAEPVGVVVALDRMERGAGVRSAIQEVEGELGLKAVAIATLDDLVRLLEGAPEFRDALPQMLEYRATYGVRSDPTD